MEDVSIKQENTNPGLGVNAQCNCDKFQRIKMGQNLKGKFNMNKFQILHLSLINRALDT